MKEIDENNAIDKNLKLIAKTSVIVFFSLALSKLFVYLYKFLVARQFGPEAYGLLSLALIVVGLFVALSSFGLIEGILRYIPFYHGHGKTSSAKYVYTFSLKFLILSGVIGGAFLFFSSEYLALNIFHNEKLTFFLKIFSIIIPLSTVSDGIISAIRASEKIAWHSFLSYLVHNVLKIIFLLFFIFLGFKTEAIAYSYVLGMFVFLIIVYFVSLKVIPKLSYKSNISLKEGTSVKSELFRYSTPLLFSSIVAIIFYWMDSFFLGYYKSVEIVGLYNAAVPIVLLFGIAPELFMKLFFPIITREYAKRNISLIRELSKQVVKWISIINIPFFVLLIIFPGVALNILFGSDYIVAASALRILAISGLASSVFGTVAYKLVAMSGKTKPILFNVLLFAILNFVLNIVFIPMNEIWFIDNSTGMNGAAIATFISLTLSSIMFCIQSKYYLSITPLKNKIAYIVLSATLSGGIILYLKELVEVNIANIIILSFSYILIYFVFILLSGSLDRNDLVVIRAFKRKIISNKND